MQRTMTGLGLPRAVAWSVLTFVMQMAAIATTTFMLMHAALGDPVSTIAGTSGGMSQEAMQEWRRIYGLDRPLLSQLATYLWRVVQGDLGQSHFFNLPVSSLITERLPATLLLLVTSTMGAFMLGTALGAVSAQRPLAFLSQFVGLASTLGLAMPAFWVGMLLMIALGSVWPLFPVSGMQSADTIGLDTWNSALDVAHHLVLPAVTLGLAQMAQFSRLARVSFLTTMGSDYIRTARAKGLSTSRVIGKHALRNAALPVVTLLGLQLGNTLGGAVLVETVFNWPGMGRLALDSALRRDYPTLTGVLLCACALVLVMNRLVDLMSQWLDPRLGVARAATR
jgi:peptide/nickel transport system permease protein